jgi:hypothetical protein
MRSAAFIAVFWLACSSKEMDSKPPPPMASAEVKRAQDACQAYVDRACACQSPVGQRQCRLAKALPEAIKLALEVALNPASPPNDAARAQVNIRETVKECIEQTAKLPMNGC